MVDRFPQHRALDLVLVHEVLEVPAMSQLDMKARHVRESEKAQPCITEVVIGMRTDEGCEKRLLRGIDTHLEAHRAVRRLHVDRMEMPRMEPEFIAATAVLRSGRMRQPQVRDAQVTPVRQEASPMDMLTDRVNPQVKAKVAQDSAVPLDPDVLHPEFLDHSADGRHSA